MARSRHPDKHIELAIQFAELAGWRFEKAGGHAHCFGKLMCHHQEHGSCIIFVRSTPRNCFNHARQIRRAIAACPH